MLFDRFESLIQRLIEGSFERIFGTEASHPVEQPGPASDAQPWEQQRDYATGGLIEDKQGAIDPTRELKRSAASQESAEGSLPEIVLVLNGRQHISMRKAVIRIGRHLENDIVVDSPDVSRHHAQISWRNGRTLLYDLSSRSGVQLNGQQIDEAMLQNGDVIRIGHMSIVFSVEDSGPVAPSYASPESPTSVLKQPGRG